MKKILLGTSAIVGASVLLAAPVWAAEKPKLEMSGYLRFEAWGVDQDAAAGRQNQGVAFEMDDAEIHFKGSAVADNGLTYGFKVELQEGGSDGSAGYDEAGIFLSGGWGRLDLGSDDAVHNNYKVGAYAISADKDGAWDGNNLFATASNAAFIGTDFFGGDDANKITYTTPSFGGFTVGVSYTPNTEASMNSGYPAEVASTSTGFLNGGNGNMNNQIGVGAQYKATFSGVAVEGTARYARADYQGYSVERDDAKAYGIGAKVGYMGFEVAGSYQNLGDSGLTAAQKAAGMDTGQWWDIGVAYGTGPYKVSVIYMQSEANDAGSGVQDDKVDYLQIGFGYAAAPGLDLYAAYQYVDLDQTGTANDNEANLFLVGTQVSF
ncbi:MAG: porin [Rhodospirillales bacterium]|nr:porin [Rhodospirillales bacterium]